MAGLGITDLTDVEITKRALLCESILITRLTKQLELIDEGFISDRSIIDELMYWELDNEKNFPSLTATLKDFVYSFLNKLNCCKKVIMITGSTEDRKKQIIEALKELGFEPKNNK